MRAAANQEGAFCGKVCAEAARCRVSARASFTVRETTFGPRPLKSTPKVGKLEVAAANLLLGGRRDPNLPHVRGYGR
jgi:hypothetical protein